MLFFNKNKTLRNSGSSNHLFFVFKINTPILQYSNTPLGVISRQNQFTLTPADNGIFDMP